MTTTLLAPSMRLANEAIAKRIVAKVRDHSPAPGLLTLDRWELAETEIRLALDAAGRGQETPLTGVRCHDIAWAKVSSAAILKR
jgi:hypothetical protein